MAQLPPLLNVDIVAASILSKTVVPLDHSVPYDGKALRCHVVGVGSQLNVTINGTAPNVLDPIGGGPFTTAGVDVSYRGALGRVAPRPAAYNNGQLEFYLRLDTTQKRATVYVVEKPPAQLVDTVAAPPAASAVAAPATADAGVPDGQITFVAIADNGGNDDPAVPLKIVFVDNQIVVPDYLHHPTAKIMFGPPALDGGGEFGPMAILIDP